ncbi:putative 20S rRNA accumulation protein 4 [Fusarium oxysporum f. sp. albedinis]|nr:putative 20S rRNA accumulation protein 4 [Fusarium oxysporum f. sp. albedinis]
MPQLPYGLRFKLLDEMAVGKGHDKNQLLEEMERIVVIEGYYWVYIGYRRCAYTHVLCPSHMRQMLQAQPRDNPRHIWLHDHTTRALQHSALLVISIGFCIH